VIIAGRFNGPADSGNGGYSAGLIASLVDSDAGRPGKSAVTVTLRRPPPLDTALSVKTRPDGGVAVYHDDRLIADALPADPPAGPPVRPVTENEAYAVAKDYPGFVEHPFPSCYVCGPDRAAGDGLRIFPAPLADGRTAAVFSVPAEVTTATVWAALDCPGGWAITEPGRRYVLGRVTAAVTRLPVPATRCVVMGELIGMDGRKAQVRSAVYGPDGALLARAEATWIGL
jgi:hypothetical protein